MTEIEGVCGFCRKIQVIMVIVIFAVGSILNL